MNLSPWNRIVMLRAIAGSRTPFQDEDSIRQVPWSLSKSSLARFRGASGVAAAGTRGLEQAVVLNKAMATRENGCHLITTPPNKRGGEKGPSCCQKS
jgi:hypothetical protein